MLAKYKLKKYWSCSTHWQNAQNTVH